MNIRAILAFATAVSLAATVLAQPAPPAKEKAVGNAIAGGAEPSSTLSGALKLGPGPMPVTTGVAVTRRVTNVVSTPEGASLSSAVATTPTTGTLKPSMPVTRTATGALVPK